MAEKAYLSKRKGLRSYFSTFLVKLENRRLYRFHVQGGFKRAKRTVLGRNFFSKRRTFTPSMRINIVKLYILINPYYKQG